MPTIRGALQPEDPTTIRWYQTVHASTLTETTTTDPAQSSGDPPNTAPPDPTTHRRTPWSADERDDRDTSEDAWTDDPRENEDEPAGEDEPQGTTGETTYRDIATPPTPAKAPIMKPPPQQLPADLDHMRQAAMCGIAKAPPNFNQQRPATHTQEPTQG